MHLLGTVTVTLTLTPTDAEKELFGLEIATAQEHSTNVLQDQHRTSPPGYLGVHTRVPGYINRN